MSKAESLFYIYLFIAYVVESMVIGFTVKRK